MKRLIARVQLYFARVKNNMLLDEIGATNLELEEAIFDVDENLQTAMAVHLTNLLVEQRQTAIRVLALRAKLK